MLFDSLGFFQKTMALSFNINGPMICILAIKKICGVVSNSKIIGNKSYIQTGIGFNLNNQPIKNINLSIENIKSKIFHS